MFARIVDCISIAVPLFFALFVPCCRAGSPATMRGSIAVETERPREVVAGQKDVSRHTAAEQRQPLPELTSREHERARCPAEQRLERLDTSIRDRRFIRKKEKAATLVDKALKKCPGIHLVSPRFSDEDWPMEQLYAMRRGRHVDWWEYSLGNGIDGTHSSSLTRLDADSCQYDRVVMGSSNQSVSGPVWFFSSADTGSDESMRAGIAMRLSLPLKLKYVRYVECDPRFASQRLKLMSRRYKPYREIASLDGKTRLFLSQPLVPPQPLYSGKPRGGPAVYFDKNQIDEMPGMSRMSARDWSLMFEDSQRLQQGELIGHTDKPKKVFEHGGVEIFHAPVRIRQWGTLVALYHRVRDEHTWVGWQEGTIVWRAVYGNIVIGSNHISHPAFKDLEGVVLLDVSSSEMRMMYAHFECDEQKGYLEDEDFDGCSIESITVENGHVTIEGKYLSPVEIGSLDTPVGTE